MSEERYKNGKIYTVGYRNDNNLIYVGLTCFPLYKRWYIHKNSCFNANNKEYNKIIYIKIRETNNINDWYIELYEIYPTENKELLSKREGEVIREIGTQNKNIEDRTTEEKKEYKKEYKKSNKYKEYQTEYREDNKDKK